MKGCVIMKINHRNENRPHREQTKSLDPKDEVEINSMYYGNDEDIGTQIVTNYYYKPRD